MPGAVFNQPTPADRNAFLYVIDGKAKTGTAEEPTYVKPNYLGVYGPGDSVRIQPDGDKPVHLLFASAQKINEPVVRGGPFVMNTMGELKQAFYDYQTGNFGK
jgi:redox-sensitive bicupin YhaK (pirin superfamily)